MALSLVSRYFWFYMLMTNGCFFQLSFLKFFQELLAYQELNHGYPDFCQRMQNKVIDLLMQDVYATENSPLWKARILIRKGRALRINGIEALKNCILCLSEAISIMVS